MTYKLSILFSIIFLFPTINVSAKHKIIIQSKDDIRQLSLKNVKTGKIIEISTWNKTGGGFLIEVDDTKNTHIITQKTSIFRLLSIEKKQTTTWIEIIKGKSISIDNCFNKHKGSKMSKDEILSTASEFIVSNYLSDPLYEETLALRGSEDQLTFSKSDKTEFNKINDVVIKWDTKKKIKTIELIDMTSAKKIWNNNNQKENAFILSKISDSIISKIKFDHQYKLNITLKNEHDKELDGEKFSYNFSLLSLLFNSKNTPAYFIAKDSINISWQSNLKINNISLIDNKAKKVIWEQNSYDKNKFAISEIPSKGKLNIVPKNSYQLKVDTDMNGDKHSYVYDFEIILNDRELKELIDFISN